MPRLTSDQLAEIANRRESDPDVMLLLTEITCLQREAENLKDALAGQVEQPALPFSSVRFPQP